MAEVDSLTIRINAETGSAVAQLKQITKLVERLNSVSNDKGWTNFTNGISRLGKATENIEKLASSLKGLQNMQVSPNLKSNFEKLSNSTESLTGASKNISRFNSAVRRLSKTGADTAEARQNLGNITGTLTTMSQTLSLTKFGEIADGVKNFVSAMGRVNKIGADQNLQSSFENVSAAVGKFAKDLNNAISDETLARLERIGVALKDIATSATAAGRAAQKFQKENDNKSVAGVKAFADAWKKAVKAIEWANRLISEMGSELYSSFETTGIMDDLGGVSRLAQSIPILGELTEAWKSAASQIKTIVLSNASVVDKAANIVLVRVSTIIRMLYSLAKLPISSMGLTKGLMKGLAVPFKNFANAIAEAKKKWDKFLSSLARVAIYRLIRTALKEVAKALKEGVNNLYMWGQAWQNTYASAAKFVETMDRLATAFLYLKNSIGAAVSPLLDAVAPVIDSLIDKFVELINVVNEAMAALSGASLWRRAIKYQYTYAEAANLTAKALKRTVLPFDELNKLDDPHKGSGKDQPDYSKMFEEVPVDTWVKDILESTSWRLLGTGIANKINEALASINWSKINSTVRIWARRLGSLLDGLFMGIDMPLAGKSFAEGLNTIARAMNTFFKEFHFIQFGKNLADGFTNMINTMSWDEIGQALTQKWKASMELLIGFKDVDLTGLGQGIVSMLSSAIENLPITDFVDAIKTLAPKIGTELGIALNGIFTETNKVMDGLDAEGLGNSLTTALDNMVKEIKPEEAGKFLTNGIKKIIEFSTGALKNESFWTDLNEWLGNLVTNMFKNVDLKTGVQNAIDFAQKIVNLLTTAINSVPWEDVGDAIASADTSGLKAGFKKLFDSVTDGLERAGFMDEVATGIATYFGLKLVGALAKVLPTVLTSKALVSAGGSASSGGIFGSFGGITGMLGMDAATVMGAGTFAEIAAYIGTGIVGALGAWFVGQKLGNTLGKWLSEAFAPEDVSYYENFSWFGEGGFFEALLDEAKFEWEDYTTQIKTGWDVIKDAFSSAKEKLSGIMDTLKQKMDNLSNSWSSGTNVILDGLSALTGANLSVFDKVSTPDKARRTTAGKITRRASGGMVDKGDLFLAGENGPEIVTSFGGESAVMNMDQIISTISQSVAVAGGGDITIPISLDGGLLDKVIVTAQQRQSLRSGR